MPNELIAQIARFVSTGATAQNRLNNVANFARTSSRFANMIRDLNMAQPLIAQIRREHQETRRQQAADARAEYGYENDGW